MITISELKKSYGPQVLFDNVGFQLNRGEKAGVVGRNGHGKTTLFLLILGHEKPDRGSIEIPKNYSLGYMEQELRFRCENILDEVCTGLPAEETQDRWQAEKILMGLGFCVEDFSRPASEFSGGYQVRVQLARTLIAKPDLLLLDEPTNYLDIISIRWLEGYLRSWPNELMLITHDRSFMDAVCTHILGIHRYKFRKIKGTTDAYYNAILKDEEIYEKTRINDEKKRQETELFIRRFRAKARLAGLVQSRIKDLQKKEKLNRLEKIETLEFSFVYLDFHAKGMIRTEGLSFSYDDGPAPLINDFKLNVASGDRIGVIGPNGKGKTTLMRLLADDLTPLSGAIHKHPKLKTGYFAQSNTAILQAERTVLDEISSSSEECTAQRARDIAGGMMFSGDMALKTIQVLSGGEKSRVMLGKLLAVPAHLLLLDEPTNHLDMESVDSLLAALDSFNGAVVLITHNEMLLRTLVNRLVVFDRGTISLFEGGYDYFLNNIGWSEKTEDEMNNYGKTMAAGQKKEPRRKRALYIQERSKALRPLIKKISRLEKKIEDEEKRLHVTEKRLIDLSTGGKGADMAESARLAHTIRGNIEQFYHHLQEATDLYEEEKNKWQIRE
ncbi:MAG TPA: ABC-F family ATP-binding cassette domain-containing protein [Spirochaetes bacterium]|nr:ABC-F family ATP-binding cassette domain-containing protein [Spirochaetota bacterium]